MTAQQWWKIYYRQYRIIRRECFKAIEDVVVFGTGAVLIMNEPDYIKHVPVEEIRCLIPTS